MDDIQDEEVILGDEEDNTSNEKNEEEDGNESSETKEEKNKDNKKSSLQIQKERWREKALLAKQQKEELEKKLKEAGNDSSKDVSDDREKAARDYIRKQAREEYELIMKQQKQDEEKITEEFQDALEDALEKNEDMKESDIHAVLDELKDDFKGMNSTSKVKLAVKIVKNRGSISQKQKPRMPKGIGGSEDIQTQEKKPTKDDANKSMWEITQEIIAEHRKQKSS